MVYPFEVPPEIISYYFKILELGDLKDCKERIHFVWPENSNIFPKTFPLTKLLYYSPKAIKHIKDLIGNRFAYIVPVNKNYIILFYK